MSRPPFPAEEAGSWSVLNADEEEALVLIRTAADRVQSGGEALSLGSLSEELSAAGAEPASAGLSFGERAFRWRGACFRLRLHPTEAGSVDVLFEEVER